MELYTGDIQEWNQHLWRRYQELSQSEDSVDKEIAWHTLRIWNFMKYSHVEKQVYTYHGGFLIRFHERTTGYGYFIHLEDCVNDDAVRREVFSETLKCIRSQKEDFSTIRYFPLKYRQWYNELFPIICHDLKVEPGIELYGGWRVKSFDEEDGTSTKIMNHSDDLIYEKLSEENASEVNAAWEYGTKDHVMSWIPLHLKYLPSMAVWSGMKCETSDHHKGKLIGQVFYTHIGVIGGLYVDESYRNRGIAVRLIKSIVNESFKTNIIPIVDIEKDNTASFSLFARKLGFEMVASTFCSMIFHNTALTLADVFSNAAFDH
jgi:GNAT superfamily N-acetyltransferase